MEEPVMLVLVIISAEMFIGGVGPSGAPTTERKMSYRLNTLFVLQGIVRDSYTIVPPG